MTNNKPCWNCKEHIAERDIFCPACNTIQMPSQADYFTKLGLQCDFEIGYKNLEVAYFAMQRKLHPDLFIKKSEKEKAISMQQTIDINTAFETLKSPLARAEYMLALQGVIVNRDNKESVRPEQSLLVESLDMREELENAKTPEAIRKISVTAAEMRIACIDEIKSGFSKGELAKVAQNTIRLRYLEKLIEEIRKK